jgi:hypothetical protein
VGALAAASASGVAGTERKLLNRSLYVPVTFRLCEHLEDGVVYQDDAPVGLAPVERIFQFTYYPDLERLLPEIVQIRVEGRYARDGEPFVARLAVTPEGVHTAHRHRSLDAETQMRRQRHKIDARLEPREIRLVCPRFCARPTTSGSGGDESVEEP